MSLHQIKYFAWQNESEKKEQWAEFYFLIFQIKQLVPLFLWLFSISIPYNIKRQSFNHIYKCCTFSPSILDCHKHLGIKKSKHFSLSVYTRIVLLALWRQVNNYVQIEIEEEKRVK